MPSVTRVESGAAEALVRWLRTGHAPEPRSEAEARALVAAADSQRVAPLLYTAVAERGDWPEAAVDRLRRLHHVSFARGVRQLALAGEVLATLEAAGVRALPLKGAALAEWIYDSVAERPMADVDVLALGSWPAAVEAVRGMGLEALASADHAAAFEVPGGVTLELHHSVTSCPGLHPLDAEGLWERSTEAPGQVRRRPAAEDLLVQLALHAAFQHGLVLSLVQYLDFKRLLAAERVSADRVRAAASSARATAALAASLAVADALLGLDADPELRSGLPPGLERWLRPRLAEPSGFLSSHPVSLARVRWELCRGRRVRLLLATLAPAPPGRGPSLPRRLASAVVRAAGLARRWLLLR